MFPKILKDLRKSRKINQAELGEALGMSQATITLWENGKRIPDIDMLCKIADYFNVTTDYLLGRVPMEIDSTEATTPSPVEPGRTRIHFSADEPVPTTEELEKRIYEALQSQLYEMIRSELDKQKKG